MPDHTSDSIQLPLFDPITIPLTKGYTTIVDPIDADLVQYKWYFNNKYAHGRINGKDEYLHRVILSRMLDRDLQSGEQVDHISTDHLDNRRSNLRLATARENTINQNRRKSNKSGFKGVSFSKGRWSAQIRIKGKVTRLGCFDTAEEAYVAYCEAAKKHHGEFARLNN